MLSRNNTTAIVIADMIATLAIAALASVSFSTAAFAQQNSLHPSSPQCPFGGAGSGKPQDAENPHNPHDTQFGFSTGNPHDSCRD